MRPHSAYQPSTMRPFLLLAINFSGICSTQAFVAPFSLASAGGNHFAVRHETLKARAVTLGESLRLVAAGGLIDPQRRLASDLTALGRARGAMKTTMDSDMSESCDRKAFFSEAMRTAAGVVLAGGVLVPERAAAAAVKKGEEEAVEEIPVDFKAEFGKVRATTKTVLMELRSLSVEGEWAVVMSKARDYDLSVRKVMMGDVRKKLPKELKEDAMAVRNSITFDLIAVNKAARVENKERALEVCDILEGDINRFLDLEKRL